MLSWYMATLSTMLALCERNPTETLLFWEKTIPSQKASKADLSCSSDVGPENCIEGTLEWPVIWDAMTPTYNV